MSARDPELTRILILELERHLVALDELVKLHPGDDATLESARRTVHALKGSAGLAGEPELAAVMLRLERRLREGDHAALTEAATTVRVAIQRLGAGERAAGGAWPAPPPDLVVGTLDPLVRAQYIAEVTDRLARIDDALTAIDGGPEDAAAEVYRHVHTMKGAASAVGDEPMAWFCHGLEERLRVVTSGAPNPEEAALAEVAEWRAVLGTLLDDPEAALATLRGVPLRPRTRPTARPAAR
ncbi:MAG: Hpt domain-containing protein, partial [Labilithrix sp.]|nr:Hpt domain-containing protein [Labilithrix sp.]